MESDKHEAVLTWTWFHAECAVSSGGSRTYIVINSRFGQYPWVLMPPYDNRQYVSCHTNAHRAMEAAELRETRPTMFLATVGEMTLAEALEAERGPRISQ